jgi:hypothetical protein
MKIRVFNYLAAFFISFFIMYAVGFLTVFVGYLVLAIGVEILVGTFDFSNVLNNFYKALCAIAIPSAFMGFVGMYEYWKSLQTQYPYTKRRKFKDIEDESWDVDVDD